MSARRMIHGAVWGLVLATALAWDPVLFAATESPAPPERVVQLTAATDCAYYTPVLSGDGQWIVATTDCGGPIDVRYRHVVRLDRASRQIEEVTPAGIFSESPSVSADGQRVAFLSIDDLVPGRNPDHVPQLFVYDFATHRYRQLTHLRARMTSRWLSNPRLTADGLAVVLSSDADLVPGENADGNAELFFFDLAADRIVQMTHSALPALYESPIPDGHGDRVLFLGTGLDSAAPEGGGLYVWDRQAGTIRLVVASPYPRVMGLFETPALSASGQWVVFVSRLDLLGENPDENQELYGVTVRGEGLQQLTHTRGCLNLMPALSADGRWVAFTSNCRFGEINAVQDGDVFALRLDSNEVIQVTRSGTNLIGFEPLSIDHAGRTVAFGVAVELPGMVNPDRMLQIVTMALPVRPDRPIVPPRLLPPEDLAVLLVSRHAPEVVFLGTEGAGLLRSINGGRSWKLASHRLGDDHVTCLAEHPEERGVLFAGTANAGLYRTTDGGDHWSRVSTLRARRIMGLALDPVYPDLVYAETSDGLMRSANGGEDWEQMTAYASARPQDRPVIPVSQTPRGLGLGEGHRLLPFRGSGGRLLRISDGRLFVLDAEWAEVPTPERPRWITAGPKGRPLFLRTDNGVYRSDGLRHRWEHVAGLPVAGDMSLLPAGPGDWFAVTSEGFHRSLDGGRTWSAVPEPGHDVHVLADPASRVIMRWTGSRPETLSISRDYGLQWIPVAIQAPSPEGLESVLRRPGD